MKKLHRILFFLLFICLAWEVSWKMSGSFLVPAPIEVGSFLWRVVRDGSLLSAMWVTCKRLCVGYLIGLCAGVPIGLLCARFRFFSETLGTLALGLQTLPSVCWVPIALLSFGQTERSMLFIVVMGCLWSILIAAEASVRNVSPLYVRAARTMGSRGFHTWCMVILPATLPFIVSGMKQGWAFAWRSLMAAEIFVPILTGFGLGQMLHYGRELNAMDQVLGVIFVIVTIGLAADRFVFAPIEGALHRRWGTNRLA